MTPKEKAKEMIGKYMSATNETSDFKMELYYYIQTAKKCALIAVHEILDTIEDERKGIFNMKRYWQEVKKEIEVL